MVVQEICMVTVDMKKTGSNIRKIRREKRITVGMIREAMGFQSTRSVYKWQRGETMPTVDNLVRLGMLLETPMEEIIAVRGVSKTER